MSNLENIVREETQASSQGAEPPINFRRRLRIAAVMAAIVLPLPFLFSNAPRTQPKWEDIDISGLPEIRSEHGVLSTTLVAAPQIVHVGQATFNGAAYNGTYPGPVLRVRPGDLVRIRLENHLSEPTNLHFHGLRVTPMGSGDNMHISVPPGRSFDYEFRIPKAQPPGLFWYHDHLHGITEPHVMAGLSGAMLIDGFAADFGGLAGLRQRMLVVKDADLKGCTGDFLKKQLHCRLISINGLENWQTAMRPGETQLWRICNQGANLWAHLALPGARMRIIGRDGTPAVHITEATEIDVMPASRLDILVTAGGPGELKMMAMKMLTGSGKSLQMNRAIGVVSVGGEPLPSQAAPVSFPPQKDLRDGPVAAHRVVVFTEDAEAEKYFVDGKLFDHERIDMRVPFGTVEEWTVQNRTQDFHEFHIHQLGFQLVEINGQKQDFDGYLDDVQVPEMGEVKLLVPFTDPIIIGSFMYHCHVLKHEDRGMMANIEVYRQTANLAAPHICRFASTALPNTP